MILIILEVIKGTDFMESYKRVMITISAVLLMIIAGDFVSIIGMFATVVGIIFVPFAIYFTFIMSLCILAFLAFLWFIYFVVLFLSKHPKLIPLYVVCLIIIIFSLGFIIINKIIQLI